MKFAGRGMGQRARSSPSRNGKLFQPKASYPENRNPKLELSNHAPCPPNRPCQVHDLPFLGLELGKTLTPGMLGFLCYFLNPQPSTLDPLLHTLYSVSYVLRSALYPLLCTIYPNPNPSAGPVSGAAPWRPDTPPVLLRPLLPLAGDP